MKGILPPTLEIILKTYCPLPARQGPLRPQQQKIPSCSLSPMPCTKPDSLRDNQTKSSSFGAQADGRKEGQIETLLEVQPDDMTGKHRDREHNPLEQPQVSGDEDKVVAGGTSHAGQGKKIIFQTEVGMDLETSQVVARHVVKLAMFQQQGTISKSTDRGGNYPLQADFRGNPITTTARVAAHAEAAIGRQQRGTTSTEQSKQFDPRG